MVWVVWSGSVCVRTAQSGCTSPCCRTCSCWSPPPASWPPPGPRGRGTTARCCSGLSPGGRGRSASTRVHITIRSQDVILGHTTWPVSRGAGDPGLGGARAQRGGGGRGGVRELRRVRGGGRDRGLGGALGVQNQPGGHIPLHLRGGWHCTGTSLLFIYYWPLLLDWWSL